MSGFVARLICSTNSGRPTLARILVFKDNHNYKCKQTWPSSRFISTNSVRLDKEIGLSVNYLKDGNDIVLRPDDEYPNWLWQLNKSTQTTEGLHPHSPTYRRLVSKRQRRDENERRKMKRF